MKSPLTGINFSSYIFGSWSEIDKVLLVFHDTLGKRNKDETSTIDLFSFFFFNSIQVDSLEKEK